jgi:hypothetical protein|tara:strand:+ start:11281 stop:11580 length:300 start_codon:yes stop_codon:yes gene_type:complete
MPIKTVTGKKFILVAKPVVGRTNAIFPDKTVFISGKGTTSGKEFGSKITVKAGNPKINLNGRLFKVDGTVAAAAQSTSGTTSTVEKPISRFTWSAGNLE